MRSCSARPAWTQVARSLISGRSRRRCGDEPSSRRDAWTRGSPTWTRRCSPSSPATRPRGRRACSTAVPSPPASKRTSGVEPGNGPQHSAAWLDELPHQSGVYLGNCRIYRSHIWCLGGDWPQALHELADVCGDLSEGFGQRIAGHAFYELGELHRLRGDLAAADDYRRATGPRRRRPARPCAAPPFPGRHGVGGGRHPSRPRRGDGPPGTPPPASGVRAASCWRPATSRPQESGAEEIATIATAYDTPVVRAELAQARGAVALADGRRRVGAHPAA